ncbi:hypothetical protein Dsin_015799 [Dipteronia sinensis]|uniref:Uncharacterized protein n=1 Tax=Dipteronia sinensis TaxID=43782 RepID=A0AAE0ACU3_9ROSI|nr:hypothetical protein Dsin_015799 [Dipteronia sinensis]
MQEWNVPDDVQSVVVLPPKGRKPRGRPSKKRKPSRGEEIVHRKCGRCRGLGHNRQKYWTFMKRVNSPLHSVDSVDSV